MNGKQLNEQCVLKVNKYLKGDSKDTATKKKFNNLFVKQFPRADFVEEDLKVRVFTITLRRLSFHPMERSSVLW